MKSFYEMMKLVENYPGAPEDFGDTPAPEEDIQGMGAAEMQEEDPLGIAADFPALAAAAKADPKVAEELQRLFSTMTPEQPAMDHPLALKDPTSQSPPGSTPPPQDDVPFMRK
jgi:hypothetical protein